MRRVLILGSGGAGKSTLARRLGVRTGLPVVHLDQHYWREEWKAASPDEWRSTVTGLVDRPMWILDGNYSGTFDQRADACDTIIFLEAPRLVCLWRVVVRRLRFRGRARPDMAPGCHEQLSWEFLRWIWTYPAIRRPKMLSRLHALADTKRVVVLRTEAEIDRFLASL